MTKTKSAKLLFGVAVLVTLVISTPLEAQRGRRGGLRGQGPNRAELLQRVRARMAEMMQQQLELTEEQATILGEAVQSYEEQRRTLARQEQAIRRRVEALMLEGGEDDEEASELLARMAELRQQEANLFRAEQARLLEILRPTQVLHLQSLRQQLGERIRRIGGGRGGPGQTPGRGGLGPGQGRGSGGGRDIGGFPRR